jgi:type III pantothenate kinase
MRPWARLAKPQAGYWIEFMSPAVVVDVGNTRIKWGRCRADRVAEMASLAHDDPSGWEKQLTAWKVTPGVAWVLAGTNPYQQARLRHWLEAQGFNAHELSSYRDLPLSMAVDSPDKAGLDRLLNAVAVNTVRTQGVPAIFIDAGSAVTVDLVDTNGVFQGGAILPGFRLMAQALHDYTAKLPLLSEFAAEPVPAKSTQSAMRAGIFEAITGGVRALITSLERTTGTTCEVFLSGGDGQVLAEQLGRSVRLWPEMTLEGIRLSESTAHITPRTQNGSLE